MGIKFEGNFCGKLDSNCKLLKRGNKLQRKIGFQFKEELQSKTENYYLISVVLNLGQTKKH
jgi:hypothetical protein